MRDFNFCTVGLVKNISSALNVRGRDGAKAVRAMIKWSWIKLNMVGKVINEILHFLDVNRAVNVLKMAVLGQGGFEY